MYPEFIEIDGIEYSIDTDFQTALECLKISEDASIGDFERSAAIVIMLFGEDVPICDESVRLAVKFLQRGESTENQLARKRDMDFEQDRGYIEASFMSDYSIDLNNVKMHWWKFCDLIAGLTEHCVLSRVRDIRNYDLSEVKDPKTRQRIINAQSELAIKNEMSKEDQEALDEFESLFL